MGEKLYGTSDLANILGVSRQTINNWIDDGLFPSAQRIGRSYAILSSDVIGVLKSRINEVREQAALMQEQVSAMESELKEIESALE